MRALPTAALILVIGLAVCASASADLPYCAEIVATKSTTAPNTWIYTVNNTSTAPQYALWVFGIEVDENTSVLSTITPAGWTVDDESDPHFITWIYMAGELEAGGSRTGFAATFTGTPAFQGFTAMFDNTDTGESRVMDGMVSGAPEPSGALVLLTGLAPLVAAGMRRRRARA